MITTDEIKLLVKAAEDNPALMKDLKKTCLHDHFADKYYRIEEMIPEQYPELSGRYLPWSIDFHCAKLYNGKAKSLDEEGKAGKAQVMGTLAETHRESLYNDLKEIHYFLECNYDDFFEQGY